MVGQGQFCSLPGTQFTLATILMISFTKSIFCGEGNWLITLISVFHQPQNDEKIKSAIAEFELGTDRRNATKHFVWCAKFSASLPPK